MSGRVVEMVGPAGAGKTTVATSLVSRIPGARLGLRAGRPAMLRSLIISAPVLLASRSVAASGRSWSRPELRSVAYLLSWQRHLASSPPADLTVLDHGPAFRLAMLVAGRPGAVQHPVFGPWWRGTVTTWAAHIDTIVCLDAPTDVLLARINGRARAHRVRGADPWDAERFVEDYREAFATVLRMMAEAGTHVVHVDSSPSAGVVADLVSAEIIHGTSAGTRL